MFAFIHIANDVPRNQETALSGGFLLLLLYLFVDLASARVRIELLELDLTLYLLLILAGKAHVARSRLELDETIL